MEIKDKEKLRKLQQRYANQQKSLDSLKSELQRKFDFADNWKIDVNNAIRDTKKEISKCKRTCKRIEESITKWKRKTKMKKLMKGKTN